MATLVATEGSSPRATGSRMWVDEDGRIVGSVTIGGCVDARVIEASTKALEDDEPALLSMALGDEDAWAIGMTCAGTIEVLVEPVDPRARRRRGAGVRCCERGSECGRGRRSSWRRCRERRGGWWSRSAARRWARWATRALDAAARRARPTRCMTDGVVGRARCRVADEPPALLRAPRATADARDLRRDPCRHAARLAGRGDGTAHGRGRRARPLRDARPLPRCGRDHRRHAVGAGGADAVRQGLARGPAVPRLQVRPAGAAGGAGERRGVRRACWGAVGAGRRCSTFSPARASPTSSWRGCGFRSASTLAATRRRRSR